MRSGATTNTTIVFGFSMLLIILNENVKALQLSQDAFMEPSQICKGLHACMYIYMRKISQHSRGC